MIDKDRDPSERTCRMRWGICLGRVPAAGAMGEQDEQRLLRVLARYLAANNGDACRTST